MDTAVKALMQHRTQVGDDDEATTNKQMREWRRQTAVGKGMECAEAYRRISFRW